MAQVAVAHAAEHELGFWRKYVFATDHKVIAKQYLWAALLMALIGGLMAAMFRWQLAWPDASVPGWGPMGPQDYMVMVTMHGTIMVFFVAMPILLGAFGNLVIPLMIGAGDMAFPRLNMASFWVFLVGCVVLLASLVVPGGASPAGWTGYPPLSDKVEFTGSFWGINLWILGLALEFVGFLLGGINFLTTVVTLRTRGMTMWRLPLIVWQEIAAVAIFLLSVGPLVAGAIMLLLDRVAGTAFFLPHRGGDPLLWQHLFWFFGHPEVYVIALPGFGIMQEILPVFARKPTFGYRTIIWCTVVACFLSLIVWAHHMYVSGIDPRLATPFSIATIAISIPFAIMIFAMIATLWRGSISFETPMLFSLGGLVTFLLGGVTGIFLGSDTADIYLHDSYFVVAHFHYTLFPVVFFAGFAGIYYWYPKMFGKLMSETLGRVHFVLTFIFFNAAFIPLFMVGLAGGPRRIYSPMAYDLLKPLQPLHVVATVATIGLVLGQLPFIVNFVMSMLWGEKAAANPWHANTLEWTVDSPPPHGNFAHPPVVTRGPYDYSMPGAKDDWYPQTAPFSGQPQET
jgi:cytochrome c oxidase subunit 1